MKNVIKTLLYMSTASIRMNCKYPGIICNDNKKEKNKRKIHKCQLQIHYCHCMHINQAHLAHLNNFFFAVNTFQPQCEMFLFFSLIFNSLFCICDHKSFKMRQRKEKLWCFYHIFFSFWGQTKAYFNFNFQFSHYFHL